MVITTHFANLNLCSWRLTLVVTALLPLMSAAQVVQTMMLTGQHKRVSLQVVACLFFLSWLLSCN